ncbi:MAG: hypothetical protein AAGF11_48665 [Myxococcota bacterium]
MAINYPVKLGHRGSSNGRVLRALRSGRIAYTVAFRHYFQCRVRFGAGDFTPEAANTQTIPLSEIPLYPTFPGPVRRLRGTYAYLRTGLAGPGLGSANIEVGDAADLNGLLTASPVLPANEGLILPTSGAAENEPRIEADFQPTLRLVLDINVAALTGGEVWIYIPFEPIPEG